MSQNLSQHPPTRVLPLSTLGLKLDRLAVFLHLPPKHLSPHYGAMLPIPPQTTSRMSYEIMLAPLIQFGTSSDG
jgi:hypothetical protein